MTAIYQLARVPLSGNPTPCTLPKVTNAKLDAMAAADVGWYGGRGNWGVLSTDLPFNDGR